MTTWCGVPLDTMLVCLQNELEAKQTQLKDAQAHLQQCKQDVQRAEAELQSLVSSFQESQDTIRAHKRKASLSSICIERAVLF
jgi:chromosome segregation ATPase